MAWLQEINRTRHVIGKGKEARYVGKGTPGSRKVTEESDYWYAVWREGSRKVKKRLFKDKAASQAELAKIVTALERGEAGIADPFKEYKQRPIAEHVAAYLADLREKGRDDGYVGDKENQLNRVFKQCGFGTLADLKPDRLDRWLSSQKCSPRTKNSYRGACLSFCNWLVRKKRLGDNPFRNVTRADGEVMRRRRALPADDLRHLLETAYGRPILDAKTIRRGERKGQAAGRLRPEVEARLRRLGRERYLLYRTAVLTGLRQDELRSLRVEHLRLEGQDLLLHLPGRFTKNGKDAILPLQEGHAVELGDWIRETVKQGPDRVFFVPGFSVVIKNLQRDLKAAAIPYQDEQGRYFDFHSFRKCTSSFLHQAKAHPRIIQLFMRHANANLTEHYDDETLHDLWQAAKSLPGLTLRKDLEKRLDSRKEEWLKEQKLVNGLAGEIDREVRERLMPELEKRLGPKRFAELQGWLEDQLFETWKADQLQ